MPLLKLKLYITRLYDRLNFVPRFKNIRQLSVWIYLFIFSITQLNEEKTTKQQKEKRAEK